MLDAPNVSPTVRGLYIGGSWVPAARTFDDLNPSAARSLEEGLEETLTIHRPEMPEALRKTLRSTDLISNCFSLPGGGARSLSSRVSRQVLSADGSLPLCATARTSVTLPSSCNA